MAAIRPICVGSTPNFDRFFP